ncbi:MAG: hypothetical protein CVV49_19760 [Spirochaetae bacterium HGW-Spirochaetae-5]|nr:MAG: hypothetical protein CVV49_19760 [Spirochaetae bacterium HGW-Spirochaetae-5]
MQMIITFLNDIFNLKKTKQPYSLSQILGMFAILLFLFPVIFNTFGYFAIPFAYMMDFIFEPQSTDSKFYWTLSVMILKILFGLVSGIWICKLIWPKRKYLSNDIKTEVVDNDVMDDSTSNIDEDNYTEKVSDIIEKPIDVQEMYKKAGKLARKIKKGI